MKYAISQIRKFIKPYHFEYSPELEIFAGLRDDIIRFNSCFVEGILENPNEDRYVISLKVVADLMMQCAVSLEEVPYRLEFEEKLFIGYDIDQDDYVIEKETIDLDQIVKNEILLHLPYRIVKEGFEDVFDYVDEF